ncbi:hypothetical protein ACFFQW_40940 [Umezawaea endophytica]|uniref:Uncharacterized protein n=1 Tax=Umezawaea endophytica TaxID=1654476 RepID=A0A9X3A6A1_9PSEU|nr:hypothetical protein [Umezawaea endophytica]MCS7484604.1 hypothetical protein [Umezawaea endophytica]
MRKTVEVVGLFLVAEGISGVIDHLWYQPIFGFVLNFVNRVVIPRLDFLTGHEVVANLAVAVLGGLVLLASTGLRSADAA